MNNLNLNSLTLDGAITVTQFSIIITCALVLALLVAWHYERYFPFVSRSQGMSKTLISIALITTLVITVVKSSLALSLGLVGALSIVRFRTPIKEPFELAYIFLAIAIGLGMGASQVSITVIAVLFVLIVLAIFSKRKKVSSESIFIVYINTAVNVESKKDSFERIQNLGEDLKMELDIRRLDSKENEERITLAVNIGSADELNKLKNGIEETFIGATFSIVDGQRLVPF